MFSSGISSVNGSASFNFDEGDGGCIPGRGPQRPRPHLGSGDGVDSATAAKKAENAASGGSVTCPEGKKPFVIVEGQVVTVVCNDPDGLLRIKD
jgi:hypothetical protein